MISAVVITKNEEKNIERCVNSLLWCSEIIILDDYSEDKTLDIIQKAKGKRQNYNAKLKIFKRDLNKNFAQQRNFGLEKARGEWVLFVDADEVISKALASEIKFKIQNGSPSGEFKINGYYINREDYFLGRWLKFGETGNIKFIRLARKEAGRWVGRIHEKWKINGRISTLTNPIEHYPHESISDFLTKINFYTDLVVQCWKEEARKISSWEIVLYPLGKFLQNYLFRLGFLDGGAGFIMASMMSFHSFLVRGKYWLMKHNVKNS